MDQVVLNDLECGREIALLARTHYDPVVHRNISRVKDGQFLGGVMYTRFTHESITCHSGAVSEHWINRDMIYACFDYPFRQLKVKRMFGFVPEDNAHAIHWNTKLGFREVGRIEGMFRHNVACIIMRLDREDCRLLKVKPRFIKSNLH